MRRRSLAAFAFVLALAFAQGARAAELTVLGVPALKPALDQLLPQFEQETGHKLIITYAGSSDLIRQVDAGAAFDVALVWPALIERLLKEGKVAADTPVGIARVAIAVAVRKGAPKPDISTTEKFKAALLAAKSVSHSTEGSSGVYFKSLLGRLGIAEAMAPKLRPVPGGPLVVGPVARGEVELAVITTPYIVLEPGADLVGPLPDELQQYVVYTGGAAAASPETAAARAFLAYLKGPRAVSVLKSQGLDPPAR